MEAARSDLHRLFGLYSIGASARGSSLPCHKKAVSPGTPLSGILGLTCFHKTKLTSTRMLTCCVVSGTVGNQLSSRKGKDEEETVLWFGF